MIIHCGDFSLFFYVLRLDVGTDLDQICFHLASLAGLGPTFIWFGGPYNINLASWALMTRKGGGLEDPKKGSFLGPSRQKMLQT